MSVNLTKRKVTFIGPITSKARVRRPFEKRDFKRGVGGWRKIMRVQSLFIFNALPCKLKKAGAFARLVILIFFSDSSFWIVTVKLNLPSRYKYHSHRWRLKRKASIDLKENQYSKRGALPDLDAISDRKLRQRLMHWLVVLQRCN